MITKYKHTLNIQHRLWSNAQGNQFTHHMQNIRLTCHRQFSPYILLNKVFYLDSLEWIHCMLGTTDRDNFCNASWILPVELVPPPPIPNDDVRPDGMTTKIKWKIYAFFTLRFKFWKYVLLTTSSFVSFCFTLAFNPLIANSVALYGNQSTGLHSKSNDWFLCGGNTGS